MQLLEMAAQCPDDEVLEQYVYEGNLLGAVDRAISGVKTEERKRERTIRKEHESAVDDLLKQLVDEYINQFPNKNKEKILQKYRDTVKKAISEHRLSAVIYFGKVRDTNPFRQILLRNGFKWDSQEGHDHPYSDFLIRYWWKRVGSTNLHIKSHWYRGNISTTGTILETKRRLHIAISS